MKEITIFKILGLKRTSAARLFIILLGNISKHSLQFVLDFSADVAFQFKSDLWFVCLKSDVRRFIALKMKSRLVGSFLCLSDYLYAEIEVFTKIR